MSHYTLATPLDTWQKIRDDMTAKGVDPDVALANAKENPAATGNTPVDETVYKCIFCRDVSGTITQYFEHIHQYTEKCVKSIKITHKAIMYNITTFSVSFPFNASFPITCISVD